MAQRRVRALLRHGDGRTERGGVELLDTLEADPGARLWIDLQGEPDEVERALLVDRLAIPKATVEEAQSPRHPPKTEAFDDFTFLLLRGLDASSESIEFGTIQIALFVGDRWLVTRHTDVSPSTDATWERVERDPARLDAGPGAIAVRLAGRVADRYLPIVLNLEKRLEEIEDEMFDRPGDDLLGELILYKRHLKKLRRIASYHVTLFDRLRRERDDHFGEELLHDVNDVWEQMERVASLASLYNDLANDLMNGYLSLASHRLNNIMKVLTIVTVIFVPLTFLAGIYGMNFEHMPELSSANGYFVVLGIMGATAVVLLWLFRRRGWL
jgi:magnesium transporter